MLPNSATLTGLAHDTVANAKAIQGMIEPDLTEAEKKKLLHRSTMMKDTFTDKLDEAINEIKKPKDGDEE